MRVQQILSVLLIHSTGYQTAQSSPYMRTNIVSTTFNVGDTNLLICQHCLLSTGGATRAKLVKFSKPPYLSGSTHADFEVTASEFGFVTIEQICRIRTICGPLEVHRSEYKNDQTIVLQSRVSRSILCLVSHATTTKCRDCLKEASDSPFLGNFRTSSVQLRNLFTLHILFTAKEAEYIVQSCSASLACIGTMVELQGNVCRFLVPENVSPDITWKVTNGLPWSGPTSTDGFKNLQAKYQSGTLKHLCLKVPKQGLQAATRCMYLLAERIDGLVIMLHKGLKEEHVNIIGFQVDSSSADSITVCGKKMLTVDQTICNELNAHQFDTTPISNQISVLKSQKAQMEQANVKIEYISECVWTRHDPAIRKCTSCLGRLGISKESILPLSQSTSLTLLATNFEKAKLASCINTGNDKRTHLQCEHFVFVPNFMCEYDLTQPEQTFSSQEQQQGTRYPVAFDKVGSSSSSRNFSSEHLASSISDQQSLRLFGKQINLESPVTMVSFKAAKASDCAASLALKYTVLMISVKKQYVWMLYDRVEPLSAEWCTNLHMCHRLQLDVHMLRAVSAEDVILNF